MLTDYNLGMRRFINIVITGTQERMLPVYVHVETENLSWYNSDEKNILNELATVLCDHIELIQQCYQQLPESSSAGVSLEEVHHIQGNNIRISYSIRKNTKQYDNTLVYRSAEPSSVPETVAMSSFTLNPLYLKPLA